MISLGRRRTATALLLVLAVLAGCTVFDDGTEPTGTVTPAPVPVSDLEEPDGDTPGSGLTAGNEFDVNALVDRHRAALDNGSYLLLERLERTVETPDGGTRHIVLTERTWVTPSRGYRYDLNRRTSENGSRVWYNRSTYAEGQRQVTLVENTEGRRLLERGVSASGAPFADAAVDPVARFLSLQERTVSERAIGGYRIVGNGSDHPRQTFTENNTATAVVTERGLVTQLSASYEARTQAGQETVAYEFVLLEANGVPEPAWADGNVTTTAP